jgi:hypothetical protein
MPSIQQDILRDDSNKQAVTHIRECRSDSNRCTPCRGRTWQHVVRMASRVSRTTIICEVPTKSNMGPCSWDEVLATSNRPTRPSSWATSFSLQQTTLKQGGAVWQNSYWTTRFTGPHKIRHAVSTNQSLSIGAKITWSSIDTSGGYHLGTSE